MNKTQIAIKGSYLNILIFLIHGVIVFWRTSIIISVYGVDVNSITQSANNIFTYLVLLESGLGAAFLYKMYEPYTQNDYTKVSSLYNGLVISLKKIAVKMFAILVIIAVFYPLILGKNSLSYISMLLIILLLGIRFIIPYYFTLSKKNILILQEKQYFVNIIDGIINICLIIFEILLVKVFKVRIELVLIVGIVFALLSNNVYKYILNLKSKKYIQKNTPPSFEGENMTKDIIVHQVTGLINAHLDTFILSIVNLYAVTVYAAYNTIMEFPLRIVKQVINNIRASIGLKLANNDNNMYKVFREILSLNYFVAMIVTSVFVIQVNSFIVLWIGKSFLLDSIGVILFASLLFRRLIIPTLYAVRDGRGLYKESKMYNIYTIICNLLISILLVGTLGIKGLLIGTVIASYLIMDVGNISLIYKKIFNKSPFLMYKDFFYLVLGVSLSILSSNIVLKFLGINFESQWIGFILDTVIVTTITSIITVIILLIMDNSFRFVVRRVFKVVFKRAK